MKFQKSPPAHVAANKNRWSPESQRTLAYQFLASYRDYHYQCHHCKAKVLFSAIDQQQKYENEGVFIYQRPTLCSTCYRSAKEALVDFKRYARQWKQDKPRLSLDQQFLTNWLKLHSALESYNFGKPDIAQKNMILKKLRQLST